MSASTKVPSTYEHPHVPLESVKGEAEDYAFGRDSSGVDQIPETSTEVGLPSSPEEPTEATPSNFSSRSAAAAVSRWLAQEHASKRRVGPYGPANNELLSEGGELLETSLPEETLAERHPDWPDLKVNLLLSWHKTAGDFHDVQERLAERPDILLYENANGTDYRDGKSEYTRGLEALSEDRHEVVNPHDWEGALMQSIQDSGIKIGSIDTTRDEADAMGLKQLSDMPIPATKNYDVTLDNIKDYYARLAEAQNKRDAIMVGRFEHEIGRILEQNPDLKERSELNILVPLGAYHTKVGHGLRRMGVKTNIEFEGIDYSQPDGSHNSLSAERSYVYDYQNRLQRSLAFGREPKHELVENTYASIMLGPVLQSAAGTEKSKDFSDYRDSIVDALEREDIRVMHDSYFKGATLSDIRAIVNHRLAAKGLPPLATTPQDIYFMRENLKVAQSIVAK